MAETVVNLLIDRLASFLTEQVKLVSRVREQVEQIKGDLESIRALLKDADRRQHNEEGVKTWVNQLRGVAYDIENLIDEYLFCIGQLYDHKPGVVFFLKRRLRFFEHLLHRHHISTEIKRIRRQLQAIANRRNDFSFGTTSVSETSSSLDTRLICPLFVEDSKIVGIDIPQQSLINLLLKVYSKPMVISVVGMGGLGKTTLLRKVFENDIIKQNFDCFAWVTVSLTYSIEAVTKNMIKELGGSIDVCGMNSSQLIGAVRNILQGKRYIVVLDDVWETKAWDDLKCMLPENALGSRIMVTTRVHDVASYCSESYEENIHKLQPLPDEEAWTLFCKRTFNGECPAELVETSEKIFRLCGGLPLAIVTIGGLLLTKNKTRTEWDMIHCNLSIELESNARLSDMSRILWLSYDDLPFHLKPCFLYFGMYPEDYSIRRDLLIQRWIAEGFVKPIYGKTLEEVAEGYFNELVNRSLVEVVSFSSYGKVSKCRVHDLMMELIHKEAKEQNFITLLREEVGMQDKILRLRIDETTDISSNINLFQLRTLFLFDRITEEVHGFSKILGLKVLVLDADFCAFSY